MCSSPGYLTVRHTHIHTNTLIRTLAHTYRDRQRMCNDLAHIYHFYLHGLNFNLTVREEKGQFDPVDISIEMFKNSQQIWKQALRDVDSLEKKYEAKKCSLFEFELSNNSTPNKVVMVRDDLCGSGHLDISIELFILDL